MDTATEYVEVSADIDDDQISRIERRTTKIAVVTGLVIPFEFTLAVTQYGTEPMVRTLAFSTVVILSAVHYYNSKQLAGMIQDHETIFNLVSHPLLRACYVCVGFSSAVAAGIVGIRDPTAAGIEFAILSFVALIVYRMTRYWAVV